MNKNFKKILCGLLLGFGTLNTFNSCNYLDANEYLNEVENLNDIWTERNSIRKCWAACYGFIPNISVMYTADFPVNVNYDEGYGGLDFYESQLIAQGKFDADNPRCDFWTHLYKGIRVCCNFLEHSHLANDPLLEVGEIDGYNADVKFLRAYFYSLLLEFYGPFVIVDRTIDYSEGNYPTKRNLYSECIDFITSELDQCIEQLPENEKILRSDLGRPSKEAAMALKARVLLVAASPLVNGNVDYKDFVNEDGVPFFNVGAPDVQKWKDAAKAYKDIIDLNKFELFTVPANDKYVTVPLGDFPGNDVEWPNGPAGIDPYRSYKALFSGGRDFWNSEVIWQMNGNRAELTLLGFPRCYNNSEAHAYCGRVCATQKLIDNYFLNNGKDISEDRELYDDWGFSNVGDGLYITGEGNNEKSPIITGFKLSNKNPMVMSRALNREPRFYATIGFTGRGFIQNSGSLYYADYRGNMLDGFMATDRPSVRTGYSITKWVNEDDRSAYGSFDKQYPIFRMAEVYLSYAEALNEYDPSNPDIVKYLNLVRFRAGLPGYELASQEINRKRIKREKYIEFAFESKRYFDSRRWKDAENSMRDENGNSLGMNGVIYGCDYNETGSDFTNRTAIDGFLFKKKNYFLPIPYKEVANYWGELVQNPGW